MPLANETAPSPPSIAAISDSIGAGVRVPVARVEVVVTFDRVPSSRRDFEPSQRDQVLESDARKDSRALRPRAMPTVPTPQRFRTGV